MAIEQILEKLDSNTKEKIEKYYYRGNIKEALNVLNNSDIIVGTRFHATILGILLNKAVIPIIYSDKTKHTLEDLKFEGKTVDIRQLDKYNVKELLSEENISYRLDIEKVRKEAETQFSKLDEVLKKEQK